jgi:hypothetical protein
MRLGADKADFRQEVFPVGERHAAAGGGRVDSQNFHDILIYLVPIRGFIKGTDKFPIQKCAIFRKFKEIKELRGGILLYGAQAIPPIDAEIAEKGHLWTETIYAVGISDACS